MKTVVIALEEEDNLWRIYRDGTKRELADERWFPTLEGAGAAAQAIVFPAEGSLEKGPPPSP